MKIKINLMLLLFSLLPFSGHCEILKAYSTSSILTNEHSALEDKYWVSNTLGFSPLNKVTGVTGSRGPMGLLGPFGDEYWNATFPLRLLGSWEDFAQILSQMYGPLSSAGPVFLTTELGVAMINFTGASHLLAPGGALHSVGNAGPMGPLGVAGMLGPNGAHGFRRNEKGEYVSKEDKVQRSLEIKSHEGPKKFDLYELYKLENFDLEKIQDTSFALHGFVNKHESVTISVKSKKTQWVNILLVNLYDLDSFNLKVEDDTHAILSQESLVSNFVSVKVKAHTVLKITLSHAFTWHFDKKPFRLYVTGSEGVSEVDRPFHLFK